jgi:hypothetical protein
MMIENLWREMLIGQESEKLADEDYLLKLLDPESTYSIFAGVDSYKNILIAIEINNIPPNIELETQSLDYFRSQRKNGTWLMALRLIDLELMPVFGRLCQDLIDASASMPSQAALIKLFKDRLNLWKKLFQNSLNGLLQKHEIKGLIAELIALENLLLTSKTSATTILMGWLAPQGTDQDFIFNDIAIEVKAISPSSTKVSISSIEQLDSILPIELWVYVLRECNAEEENSINLLSQVLKVEQILNAETNALNIFKAKMLESRYVENEYYESICFNVSDEMKFTVTIDFPKLKREITPSGILEATYNISLSSISSFRI